MLRYLHTPSFNGRVVEEVGGNIEANGRRRVRLDDGRCISVKPQNVVHANTGNASCEQCAAVATHWIRLPCEHVMCDRCVANTDDTCARIEKQPVVCADELYNIRRCAVCHLACDGDCSWWTDPFSWIIVRMVGCVLQMYTKTTTGKDLSTAEEWESIEWCKERAQEQAPNLEELVIQAERARVAFATNVNDHEREQQFLDWKLKILVLYTIRSPFDYDIMMQCIRSYIASCTECSGSSRDRPTDFCSPPA